MLRMKHPHLLSKILKGDDKILIGSSALGVYAFLLHRWYRNKCQDFILSDAEVSEKLGMSINTLRVLKKKLKNHNLIEFEVRSGLPCGYKIVTGQTALKNVVDFKANEETKKKDDIKSKPKKRKHGSDETTIGHPFNGKSIPSNIIKNPNIPSFDEFLSHAKTLRNYSSAADSKIEKKYNYWLDNGWNNDYNRPIIDWKIFLKSMLQYIIASDENEGEILKIPTINRPNIIK